MPLEGQDEMRMMMTVSMPVEAGNAAIANGTLGSTMQRILGEMKAEAAYFATHGGERTGYIFFDMTDSSQLPAVAEPFFLAFNARIDVQPAMNAQDLAASAAGMERAAKSYGPKG
jgi:hypothetical protein